MAIQLNDSIKVNGGKPVEDKRLNNGIPYTSISQVNSLISKTNRYPSLEVLVNDIIHWYSGGIEDNNLIPKTDFTDAPSDNNGYIRKNGLWELFNGIKWRELQNSERLNDVKELGILGVFNSALVTEARDFPHNESRGGVVLCLPMTLNASTLTIFQLFLSVGTKNGGDYLNESRIYLRSFVNNRDWLPWREFDGGKLHTVTDNTLNLGTDYKGFPVDNSTFILTKGTTITVPNNQVLRAKFIKNTAENITFNSTLPFVGEKVISSPVGSIIDMNANKTNVFINQGGSGEPIQITHKIGLWN